MDSQTFGKPEWIPSPVRGGGRIKLGCSWDREKNGVYWSGGWGRVAVGVRPLQGVGIGCGWGPGLVECEVHLRTVSPVVCTNRLKNRGLRFGGETGGEGKRKVIKQSKGWNRMAEDSRRRIRQQNQ